MTDLQSTKQLVRDYYQNFDNAETEELSSAIAKYTGDAYHWRGMHPFYEQKGVTKVADIFWKPLKAAFTRLQRREDMFFAGNNDCDGGNSTWVVSAGNLMGLFDENWLGIPATGKLAFLRYAEFHRVENRKIIETAMFCDILSVMHQVGHYPLPPMTGATFLYPGPRTHDGILLEACDPSEGEKTMALVNQMAADLNELNKSCIDRCDPEYLARTWHDNMVWYGPTGIGASYTIERYQQQHQYPFRENLTDKVYNGHIARVAEGNYCGFFGWPNLNNRNKGGFLGLPSNDKHAPMRVVDLYRREGDKLAENWVYIDLLHYLFEQGLDVLERMRQINRT